MYADTGRSSAVSLTPCSLNDFLIFASIAYTTGLVRYDISILSMQSRACLYTTQKENAMKPNATKRTKHKQNDTNQNKTQHLHYTVHGPTAERT
jgi:hypothetical protein